MKTLLLGGEVQCDVLKHIPQRVRADSNATMLVVGELILAILTHQIGSQVRTL